MTAGFAARLVLTRRQHSAICNAVTYNIMIGERMPPPVNKMQLHAMMTSDVQPVYRPDNEPYLGSESLLAFDLAIPRAMQVHAAICPMTFSSQLSPLQRCATEIIPQGISIALSIRELVRQAYLFSAAILMRPLVDRTGLMQYILMYPLAVQAWHDGWPRKDQPTFDALFALVMPDATVQHREQITSLMHKLVHTDPKSALFNMFKRPDGSLAFASGKIFSRPDSAEVIIDLAHHCLRKLTAMSAFTFDYQLENVQPPCPPGGAASDSMPN